MRLTVIGIGYLGLTHAVCMAELGHDVVAIDVDEEKIAKAARAEVPFFEPGLAELLRKNLDSGRLRFTTSWAEVADSGDVHFLCVGTPQGTDGAADLRYVNAASDALAPYLAGRCLVVGKSTVPVGTAREVHGRLAAAAPAGWGVEVAWNPEFLREGLAVRDSLTPDRLVFGVSSEWAAGVMRQVYARPLAAGVPGLVMDLETAELVKVSANAFLATKISFINAMAEVCETVGADVVRLTEALSHDERIGRRFLSPGLGFGGGCLPKDIRAFRATAMNLGIKSVADLLGEVDAINSGRRARVVEMAREAVGGSLAGRRVAVLGVAFKPGSDDVRDSPSLDVCARLRQMGRWCPCMTRWPCRTRPGSSRICGTHSQCQRPPTGAHLVLHLTEWADYQAIDPAMLAGVVARRTIIDARCALDARLWRAAGWTVRAPGRP